MGLDAVEIVMAVEETFDIRIEGPEAEIIRTPRQLISLVWSKVAQADSTICLSHRAFNRLRKLLMRRCAISRNAIVPTANFTELLNQSQRRELAGCLEKELGTGQLKLIRPTWLSGSMVAVAVLLGVAATLPLQPLPPALSVLVTVIVAAAAGYVFEKNTRQFRTEFPKTLASVGAVSGWIVAHKPDLATELPSDKGWTREQVALRVRELVVEHLNCAAEYHEDARFIEDLGLT